MIEANRGQPRLFLFDIDGTLITSGGAGESAFEQALERVGASQAAMNGMTVAGKTDLAIARELLERCGIEATPEKIAALADAYLSELAGRLPASPGYVLPGIIPLLERLATDPLAVTALLTGNLERGARLKLVHYGVWRFFAFGAFADDHHDRNELGKVAMRRAVEIEGIDFPPERIFVIGDTPRDIACGKVIGAKTVAVATGGFSREELLAHEPDFLLDDFRDPLAETLFFGS